MVPDNSGWLWKALEGGGKLRKVQVEAQFPEVADAGSGKFGTVPVHGSGWFRKSLEGSGSLDVRVHGSPWFLTVPEFRKVPVQVAGARSERFPTALEGSGAEPSAGCKRRLRKVPLRA